MRAIAKLERGPGLTMTRVARPAVGHNDVMIRNRKTAICGTDIHIWNWDEWAQKTIPVPMHVGHEYVGEIVEIGQEAVSYTHLPGGFFLSVAPFQKACHEPQARRPRQPHR